MARSRYGDFELYRRLARQARSQWSYVGALFLVGLLSTPLTLLTPLPLKLAVDSVLGSRPLPSAIATVTPAAIARSPTALLVFVALFALLIALLTQLQALASKYLTAVTGERLVLDFRAAIFRHLQRLSLSYHDSVGSADSVYRIQNDVPAIRFLIIDGFIPSVSAGFALAGMIYVMVQMDWQLTLAALVISPPLLLVTQAYRPLLRRQSRDVKKLESGAMAVVHEVLGALRIVKAFGQEDRESERFIRRSNEGVRGRIRLALAEGHFNILVGLTTAAGTAAVLFVGIRHVRSGVLSLGDLLLIMGYVGKLYDPIKTISRKVATVQGHLASTERAFALLDEPSDVEEGSDARPIVRARGAIAFRQVSFGYGKDRPVLHGVSFTIQPGTRLGLVGASGAGKSTLINLLMRLYDPTSGQILLDGVDLREYNLADLRRQFAVVPQEPVLFSMSIAENIAYANPGADHNTIVAAAQAANAHEFILRLPRGYDTSVGERGVQLSGGQRQRIAIARAFLQDSPVLILDEPTSAVDADAEAALLEAIRRLMRSRSVILITHRSSMLEGCVGILVLENGRVVANSASPVAAAAAPAMRSADTDARPTQRSNVMSHPSVRAWRQLNPHAEPRMITPLVGRRRKNSIYRLEGAGRAGVAVIAKRSPKATALIERTVYEEVLPRLPVPSLHEYGYVEEPDGEHGWLFLEEATGVEYLQLLNEHRSRVGRWLGLLHTSAAGANVKGRLPDAGPGRYLDLLWEARTSMLQNLDNPVLTPDDVAFIEALEERLRDLAAHWHRLAEACDGVPQTLVHGDFSGKNMRLQSSNKDTNVLVFDWETAGWGVPAVDLAQSAVPSSKLAANADIATYWSTVRQQWPETSPEAWQRLAYCGTVFRSLAVLYWQSKDLTHDWAHSYVGSMRMFAAEVEHALVRLDWVPSAPPQREVVRT
jgi:ATP-binding cassette, subfamily B, bacterial